MTGRPPLSVRDRYQRIAPFYDMLDVPFEYLRYRRIRPLLFEGLSGRILDAGVGTGRNMPFYPPGADMVGIDVSPGMLARAERRRAALNVQALLMEMNLTRLTFPDASFDAAVATFVFDVLPEDQQAPALRELARVVRPAGPIRLLDYVRPKEPLRRGVTRLWEPWIAWAYGAGYDRDTERHVREAGLVVSASRHVAGTLIRLIEVRSA